MMRVWFCIAACASCAVLSACGRDEREAQVSASFTGEGGKQVEMALADTSDVDWPDGFSLYPGARITGNMAMRQDGGSGMILSFETTDTVADVIAFYRGQAEAAGMRPGAEMRDGATRMVESRDFRITAAPAPRGGTTAQLILSQGM